MLLIPLVLPTSDVKINKNKTKTTELLRLHTIPTRSEVGGGGRESKKNIYICTVAHSGQLSLSETLINSF